MADYPQAPTYRPVDWSWLGNLPDDYYKGASNAYNNAQLKRQDDEAQAFQTLSSPPQCWKIKNTKQTSK